METRILFHIQRHPVRSTPRFSVGKSYEIFEPFNDFWKFYTTYNPHVLMNGGVPTGIAKFAYYCVQNKQIDQSGLAILADTLKETGMLMREYVFETVRASRFPEKPSRQKCIWLTEENQVKYWFNWLNDNSSSYSVFQLECTGRFHTGGQVYLNSDIMGFSELESNANMYWHGLNTEGFQNHEIIFTRKAKVIGKHEVAEFR